METKSNGAWFSKDKGGEIFNLWGQRGKAKCLWENPSNCQLPFLSFFSNHLFLPECGWVSYCMKGEEYGQPKFRIGQRPIFGKTCSDFLGKKNVQKRIPFCCASTFFSFSHVLGAAGVSCVFFLPRFWLWLHFSHGLEVIFVMPGPGLSSSRFWSC